MEGRFFAWCLLIAVWLIILGGVIFLLYQFDLSEWQRFVALIPIFIVLRISIQRFLAKGRR
jgi:hypothetical protein